MNVVEGASISLVILMAYFLMPRSSVQRIIEELAWVRETPDPAKCGCRDVRCGKENGHHAGKCGHAPTEKLWTFRWEYFCAGCREYQWNGSKVAGSMTAR